jgi:lysophospholipase L1-like esterase
MSTDTLPNDPMLRILGEAPALNVEVIRDDPAKFQRYRAAAGKAFSGTAASRQYIVLAGDSITAGLKTNGDSKNIYVKSPSVALSNRLGYGTIGSRFGSGGTVAGETLTTLDPRVTYGAGWQNGAAFTIGGSAFYNNSTTNVYNFAPADAFDTFDTFYATASGAATFNISIDGGAVLASPNSATGGTAIGKTNLTTTSGIHTVNLARTGVGGQLTLLGVDTYSSTDRKMSILNLGACSSRTSDWADPAAFYGPLKALQFLAPGLVCFQLGANDMLQNLPLVLSLANYQKIIDAVLPFSDILLFTPMPIALSTVSAVTQYNFRMGMLRLAESNNLPIVDLSIRNGDFVQANSLGLMFDQVHPTAAGAQDLASCITPVVRL